MTMNTINHRHPQIRRLKLAALLNSDLHPAVSEEYNNNIEIIIHSPTSDSSSSTSTPRNSNSSSNSDSPTNINHLPLSPYAKSPWIVPSPALITNDDDSADHNCLIGSIVRQQQGHVYSLAVSGDLLYTGSDSKNIRVWRNLEEFAGFKSKSGLVKAIVIHGDRIFTGHQDGKIRIWNGAYKRVGSLPTLKNSIKSSFSPKNYVEVRGKKSVLKIKHYDAVSSMALDSDLDLLYSGSWDKTLKVWRIRNNDSSDYKCLESINAHDDAINAVATGFDSLVFTGSADGTVKVWRREVEEVEGEARFSHSFVETILEQEEAVTALAVSSTAGEGGESVLYCASSDGMVNFSVGGKQLSYGGAMRGHKTAVLCVVTAGNLVLSGSADNTICVWRREAGGLHVFLSVLTGHSGPVKCLAVDEENGNELDAKRRRRFRVYSGSLDSSVKIWRVEDHALSERRDYNQNQSPRISYSQTPPLEQNNRR